MPFLTLPQRIDKAPTCVSYRKIQYETHVQHESRRSQTYKKTTKKRPKRSLEKRIPWNAKNIVFLSLPASKIAPKTSQNRRRNRKKSMSRPRAPKTRKKEPLGLQKKPVLARNGKRDHFWDKSQYDKTGQARASKRKQGKALVSHRSLCHAKPSKNYEEQQKTAKNNKKQKKKNKNKQQKTATSSKKVTRIERKQPKNSHKHQRASLASAMGPAPSKTHSLIVMPSPAKPSKNPPQTPPKPPKASRTSKKQSTPAKRAKHGPESLQECPRGSQTLPKPSQNPPQSLPKASQNPPQIDNKS